MAAQPPQQHQPANYSLPAINQSMTSHSNPMQSSYNRDREVQEAREREAREREHEQNRQEQQRERDIQEQQLRERQQQVSQQNQAEPIQIHQPVAVGPQVRSAIHNGILSKGGSQAPGASSGPQGLFSPHYDRTPQGNMAPAPPQSMIPFPSNTPGVQQMAVQGVAPGQQPILNDALSYLDQVKVEFSGNPHVYNQFLDIMKDFKSQAIDTPGVIRRVSTLFTGHPNLIQGFNTFLPPGYRIECGTAEDPNAIRVTTPMGTVVPSMGSTMRPSSNPHQLQMDGLSNDTESFDGPNDSARWQRGNEQAESLFANRSHPGPPFGQQNGAMGDERRSPFPGSSNRDSDFVNEVLLARQQESQGVSQLHEAAVSAATAMSPLPESAGVLAGGLSGILAGQQGGLGMEKRGPVEFNHAISYVNKIKNRFSSQPEIYKQFLEILQTYQRESKPIQDVYAQVTTLFDGAPDLLQDFKQFLPDSAAHAREIEAKKAAEEATMLSNVRGGDPSQGNHRTPRADQGRMPPMGNFAPTPSAGREGKRKRVNDRQGLSQLHSHNDFGSSTSVKNGFGTHKRGKQPHQQPTAKYPSQPDAPVVSPMLVPQLPSPMPPTTSSAATSDELAFFDRAKKFIGNKNSFTEFLKLCNLFSQDLIDKNVLVYRAQAFIGSNPELFTYLKNFLQYDGRDQIIENRARPVSGRVNLNNCRSLGQSYRHLPQRERQKACSGRDELCDSVLNNEWVSHPTWASEDSGFIAHKKNVHEESLHRVEEERHDYDLNISSLERMIQFLEPFAQQNRVMSDKDRKEWALAPDFAGQSLPIYKKVLSKIYGRETAQSILEELVARPSNVVPVILQRCRMICEQWKASQREWEKVWRDQTLRMFWKSLDHQGIQAKQADKRQFQTKTLQNEIQVRFEEQKRSRQAGYKAVPLNQHEYQFMDEDVLYDTSRMILLYADHNHSSDVPQLVLFLKEFIPLFFGFDAERFQDQMDSFTVSTPDEDVADEEDAASEDASASRGRRMNDRKSDLRRGVLDRGRSGRPNRSDNQDSAAGSRATTPDIATPADEQMSGTGDDGIAEDLASNKWIYHPIDGNVRQTREVKPNAPFKRQTFNLYANLPIFCFFRMFTIIYDRLHKLKQAEASVKDAVRRAKASKPAIDLHLTEKLPENYFQDTSPNADYYRQMLVLFEELVRGDGSVDGAYVEDVLRRFYLHNGWQLYSFERMLGSATRFALAIWNGDGKDRSNDILQLFTKDRKKTETTHGDELMYRRQVEKYIKEGDIYRIAYVSSQSPNAMSKMNTNKPQNATTRLAAIRVIRTTDSTFSDVNDDGLVTAEQRWAYYVSSYTNFEPTEAGVPLDRVIAPYVRRVDRLAKARNTDEFTDLSPSAPPAVAAAMAFTAPADDAATDAGEDPDNRPLADAAKRKGGKSKLHSNESLGARISPDTYKIHWLQQGSGMEQEWWLRVAPAKTAAAPKSRSKPSGAEDEDAEMEAQISETAKDAAPVYDDDVTRTAADVAGQTTEADDATKAPPGDGETASAEAAGNGDNPRGHEHDHDTDDTSGQFEEKFVMNNRWMAGLRRDEVESKNSVFGEWLATPGTVKEGDVAMEGS